MLRRDCGRFVMDPQEAYDLLCNGLADRQLSLDDLVCMVSEEDVAHDRQILRKESTADSFLTDWEEGNKKKYEHLFDEKFPECPHSDQVFVVGQNPDKYAKFSAKGLLPLFTKTDRITWLRKEARHLTAKEKLMGHGWPMNQQLAELLKIPATQRYRALFLHLEKFIVFDESARSLRTPHAAVGNGQHIPCATIALLAVLCSVELFPTATITKSLQQTSQILNVGADGRCFFSCCFLWSKGISEQRRWLEVIRNQCGFAIDQDTQIHEDAVVREFFQEIVEKQSSRRTDVKFDQTLSQLEQKFTNYVTPEHEDIEFFLELIRAQLVLVGADGDIHHPLQTLGCAQHEKIFVSNRASADGAGKLSAHFRFVVPPYHGPGLKNLVDKADEAGLAKYGTTDQVKERLLGHWMKRRCKEIQKEIQNMVKPAQSKPDPAPPEPASAPSAPSKKATSPVQAPADAEGAGSGGGSSGEPVLFGRSTVTLTPANVDDKTNFFADMLRDQALNRRRMVMLSFLRQVCKVFCQWQRL
eukprot:s4195_g3.t1